MVGKNAKTMGHGKFLKAQTQCTIKYSPIAYTTTIDEDLDSTDFVDIFYLINISVLTYEYYPKLTHFLFSWYEHKKDKQIPLVGPNHIPPSFWRLGLRKSRTS
jgi:hypothetical protein